MKVNTGVVMVVYHVSVMLNRGCWRKTNPAITATYSMYAYASQCTAVK